MRCTLSPVPCTGATERGPSGMASVEGVAVASAATDSVEADVSTAAILDLKKAAALPRPLVGARQVAGVMLALFRSARRRDIRFERAIYNSAPAVVIYSDGDKLEGVFVFEVIDDVITNLCAMRNPDKLAGIAIPREISRS